MLTMKKGGFLLYLSKKILYLLLILGIALATIVPNQVFASDKEIPVYNTIEEWEKSGDTSEIVRINNNSKLRYMGGYSQYKLVETKKNYDIRVGYHPNFPNWGYWDGYYFSTTSKVSFSPSVSLAWGVVSVGVSVAKSTSSSGTFKKADGTKRSRPWVRADITTKIYDQLVYDDFGKLIATNKRVHKVASSSDIQIFIEHR